MNQPPNLNPEPDPEFNQRCLDIVGRWQSGALPFQDAADELAQLGRVAIAENYLANLGRVEQLLGYMQSYRGSLNTAIHHYERARALYTQINNIRRVGICDLNMGEAYRYKGDFKRARALFDRAYEAFRGRGDVTSEAMAIGNRGQMLLSMGHLEAARADLMESCRVAQQLDPDDPQRDSFFCEMYQALTLLRLAEGDLVSAWVEARRAFAIARNSPEPLERGFANRAIAQVLTELGHSPDADFDPDPDVYFQAANEAFCEINIEGEMARTMFAHARSLARRGRRMTAARKLQLAMVMFSRLGMVDDAAKAAAAQREVL